MAGLPLGTNWKSSVAEIVGFEALAQRVEKTHERLGYYSSAAGEVDYFSPKRWAIELKWSAVAHNMSPAFHAAPVPEKFVWTQSNFLDQQPELPRD